ncbi:VapE domain-containing protein [Nioella ostreopsis]|uniref:VapE domain-containing protein n=1 Tax=Nioella ostreopsis TaxID=2448479 RepID=UPI0013DEC29D|nr:VapE domain-containing protein [Nioella ostreopsis]
MGRGKGLGKIENVRWSVKKLIRKLSKPLQDTSITFSQYQALQKKAKGGDKAANDLLLEKKRVAGNWTAARYSGTTRKVADVVGKSAVVLDIDNVSHDQLEMIQMGAAEISEFAWFMHTSRSHCPEKPKVRLIVWVNRLMTPDESHAIHRLLSLYLAEDPDEAIEIPDVVSFRTNQTMFWPSISDGQEFWTDENVASVLDVDEFLSQHPGWENYENLPYQEGEKKRGKLDPNKRMEDPREKPNPIGAFCRAYSVEDVIEKWLDEIYIPGDSETEARYTYVEGSASNGAVVYEDGLFLHSNHGTDPIEGSANAWDLLRVHKFGHLDGDVHANTSISQYPSYKAMVKLAQSDPRVAEEEYAHMCDMLDDLDDDDDDEDDDLLGDLPDEDDDLGDLLGDLPDEDDDGEDEPPTGGADKKKRKKGEKPDMSWTANLLRKANGDLEANSVSNPTLLCENHPLLRGRIGYNEFTQDPVCMEPIRSKRIHLPSPDVPLRDRKHGRKWTDDDDASIKLLLSANEARGGLETDFSKDNIQVAVLAAGKQNPVHPVKDFLEECHARWVKEGRPTGELERLASDYLGCPDTVFHRESSVMFPTAAVARVYEPGCKVDVMTVIEGLTGSGKSTFWQVLFGGFCTELKCELDDTGRLVEQMRGWWALEMAEMYAAKRADANTLKMQLSSAADQHRLAYARREAVFKRQSVFTGTSNDDDYLTDPTSVRRFWVWRTTKSMWDMIDIERLRSRLWAIWGEAYQNYLDMRAAQPYGELRLDLHSREAILEQQEIAQGSRKRTAVEEIAEVAQEWLDTPRPASEVMVDGDGLVLDEYADDDTPMVRNMVTAKDLFEALRNEAVLQPYRNADVRTFGKALALLDGWTFIGQVRRHNQRTRWYVRGDDGPVWVPANTIWGRDEDDMLG